MSGSNTEGSILHQGMVDFAESASLDDTVVDEPDTMELSDLTDIYLLIDNIYHQSDQVL
jgi:hypothetical protein